MDIEDIYPHLPARERARLIGCGIHRWIGAWVDRQHPGIAMFFAAPVAGLVACFSIPAATPEAAPGWISFALCLVGSIACFVVFFTMSGGNEKESRDYSRLDKLLSIAMPAACALCAAGQPFLAASPEGYVRGLAGVGVGAASIVSWVLVCGVKDLLAASWESARDARRRRREAWLAMDEEARRKSRLWRKARSELLGLADRSPEELARLEGIAMSRAAKAGSADARARRL